jgi:uncharacterized protein
MMQPRRPYMNPYLAGMGLGLVLLAAFVIMGRGLGASGAFSSTTSWLVNVVAPGHAQANEYFKGYLGDGSMHPLKAWLPRASTTARLLCAFAGGMLMAFGAHLARGCTSGQALTGGALLNAGSWAFMIMVFVGGYAAAWFMRWQWR